MISLDRDPRDSTGLAQQVRQVRHADHRRDDRDDRDAADGPRESCVKQFRVALSIPSMDRRIYVLVITMARSSSGSCEGRAASTIDCSSP